MTNNNNNNRSITGALLSSGTMPRASFLRGPYPAKPTPPSSTAAPLLRGNITNNTNRNNTTPASAAAIQHGTPAVSTISTTSTTTSATTTFAAPHTTVEDKLHAAAAALKKSRDTAHRDHQVAIERLRLVEDEIATLTAAVEQAQFQCERMTAQMPSVRDDVAAAKRAVEHLAQKVQFQHAELSSKRGQVEDQRKSMTLRGNERAAALTKLRNLVIQKRQQQQMRDTSTAGNAGGSVEDDAIRVAQVDSALQLQRRNTKFAPGMLVDLWNDTTAAGVSSKFQAEQAARWASWMKQDAQAIRRDALETRRRVAQLKGAVIDDSDKLKTTATAISNIGNGSCPPEDVSIQTSI